jgi:hypothetical protein
LINEVSQTSQSSHVFLLIRWDFACAREYLEGPAIRPAPARSHQ